MELGERLAAWRKFKDVSQGDVARALNISRAAVSQWEEGDTAPTQGNLQLVVDFFEVTMEEFYGPIPKTPKRAAKAS